MPRIFATLAVVTLCLLATTLLFGLTMGDVHDRQDEAVQRHMTYHFLLGTASALTVVLVHSIAVTYFIGTSRWCREVVETYALDPSLLQQSARIKRRAFPWSLVGMLTIVAVSAVGAASDPATGSSTAASWASWHLALGLGGTALIATSFFMSWTRICDNQAVVEQVLAQVYRIRSEKGLEPVPAGNA